MSESEFGAPKVTQIAEAHEFRSAVRRIRNPIRKVDFVCSECGGNQIEQKFWAKWNKEKQEWYVWEVIDEDDITYCANCSETGYGIDEVYQ